MESAAHIRFMSEALRLARRGLGHTHPNPMVGALVVRRGLVVGRGYHHRAGDPHGEILALRHAGTRARGATLYVTLEPCAHAGRTPPCVDAVIASGVARVVAAMRDPNPRTNGRGFRRLRAAGIRVIEGVLADEARALNDVFVTAMTRRRPLVAVKVAQSLDGKIATSSGQSRWISGRQARAFVHRLRAQVDAILVGVNTVLADDPLLTVRGPNGRPLDLGRRPPLRIVVDGALRTPSSARLFRQPGALVIIATTRRAASQRARRLEARGAEVVRFPAHRGGVDLRALCRWLARREIRHLLIEGGGEVVASALTDRLVDRVHIIQAPLIIGGRCAPTSVGGDGIASLASAIPLEQIHRRRLGDDWLIEGRPRYPRLPRHVYRHH